MLDPTLQEIVNNRAEEIVANLEAHDPELIADVMSGKRPLADLLATALSQFCHNQLADPSGAQALHLALAEASDAATVSV